MAKAILPELLPVPPNPSGLCHCGCGRPTRRARDHDLKRGNVKGEHLRFRRGHHPKPQKRGAAHPLWKGGRFKNTDGYIVLRIPPEHPFAGMGYYVGSETLRQVLEHRLVMAEYLGRFLERHEHVHHINGDRSDNRIENLQLRISATHAGGLAYACLDCGSGRIGPVPLAEGGDAHVPHFGARA